MKTCAVFLLLELTAMAAGASSDDYYKAIRANDLAQLKNLVSAGDVNVKDRRGATPLLFAASNGGSIEVVRLLLSKGAEVKPRLDSGVAATPDPSDPLAKRRKH